PELNDEFAQDVSEFDTLDEYKASIKENLEKGKETKRRIDKRSAIIDKVCANAQVDVPQIMIDEKVEAMFDEAKENLSRQGISIDLYYTYTKHTEESLKEEFRGPAEKNVKAKLVLEAIAKAENMEVSDEEYREKLEHLSKIYNMEAEKLEKSIGDAGRKAFTDDILIDRAFDLIEDEAIEIPAAPKAEEKAE
ncbi:MAG: trigger factor, partial [Firmicutes bacterium]|nr:trigger factor [Bacillota bacterium]